MKLTLSVPVTHSELVLQAARWLKKKCSVVLTELVTTGETPDAIGWQGTHSTLIECKVSRADFIADRKKRFRQYDSYGLGCHRYYLSPMGLLTLEEIPEPWGLLELTDCGICVTRKSGPFNEVAHRSEIGLLLSALRRIGHAAPNGVSIKCYTIETKNTATLGVSEPELNEPFQITPYAPYPSSEMPEAPSFQAATPPVPVSASASPPSSNSLLSTSQ